MIVLNSSEVWSRWAVLGASVHAKGGKEKGKLDCQVGTRAWTVARGSASGVSRGNGNPLVVRCRTSL